MQHSTTLLKSQIIYRLTWLAIALGAVVAVALVLASGASAIPGDGGGGGGGGGGTTVEVNISAPVANTFHTNAPALNFTKTAATVATCLVDGDFNNATEFCTSGWTPPFQLSEGNHTYSVAIESADGSSTASAHRSFVIDRTAPGLTLTKPAGPVQNNPSIGITVNDAHPGAISCSVDGGLFLPCGNGTAATFAPSLNEGTHEISVEAADLAGNATIASVTGIVVDQTMPAVTMLSGGLDKLNDSTPTFAFAVSDASATTKKCRVVNVTSSADCSSPYTTIALADGTFDFEVVATDAAGNSSLQQWGFSIDATAPALSITPLPGDKTTDTTVMPVVDAQDVHLDSVLCSFDAPVTSATPGDSCTTLSPVLSFGQHTLFVRAADTYGNVTEQSYVFTVVDPSAPPAGGPTGPAGPGSGGGNGVDIPTAAVSIAGKSGKAKRGRVPITLTVIVKPAAGVAACGGSVKLGVKPGTGKAVTRTTTLKVVRGACVAKTTIKLATKLKGKKATATAVFGGSAQVAPFSVSKSLRRL